MKWLQVLLFNTIYSFADSWKFQVLLCTTNDTIKYQSFVYTQLNDQTVTFQIIQFSISHLFAYSLNAKQFWPIDRTLSKATTPGQSRPGSNGNEGVLRIPTTASLFEPPHQSVQRRIEDTRWRRVRVLLLCRDAVGVFYSPSRLGRSMLCLLL